MRPNRHVWDGGRVTLPGAEGRLALETWIEAATRGFSPPAKERISLEIAQHYFDSVAAQMAEGVFEPAAHFRARVDLGDARKARRRFRRHHLTESDVERATTIFSVLQKPWRLGAVIASHILFGILMISMAFSLNRARNGITLNWIFFLGSYAGLVGTGVILPAFLLVKSRSGRLKPDLRKGGYLVLMDWFFVALAYLMSVTISAGNAQDLIWGWIMAGILVAFFIPDLFLLRKIRSMPQTDLKAETAGLVA
jgi:hypothetical protein